MSKPTLLATLRNPEAFAAIREVALSYARVFAEALKASEVPTKVVELTERERHAVALTKAHFGSGDGHRRYLAKLLSLVFDNPAIEQEFNDGPRISDKQVAQRNTFLELGLANGFSAAGETSRGYVEWLPLFITGNLNNHNYMTNAVVLTTRLDSRGHKLNETRAFELDLDNTDCPVRNQNNLPGYAGLRMATVQETEQFFKDLSTVLAASGPEASLNVADILGALKKPDPK